MRDRFDTASEFEPIEIASGAELDAEASKYGVTRLLAEPDESLRERTRDAMQIRRASDRAQRGESLVPPEPNPALDVVWSETAALRAENDKLRRSLDDANETIFRLRAILVDVRNGAENANWGVVGEALRRFGGIR